MALKGSYNTGAFQRLVAASYMIAPIQEPDAVEIYKLLAAKIEKQHAMLSGKFNLVPTMGDPYPSMKALTKDIEQQRAQGKKPTVPVYAAPPEGADKMVISNDQNVKFRGVHDIIAHYYGQHPFSARGEYAAYNRHLKTLPPKCAYVLFTEIVGQTSVYKSYGDYCTQKTVILRDFNPFRIGELAPESPLNRFFVLSNKALEPRPGFSWQLFHRENPKLGDELLRQPGFLPKAWEEYSRATDKSLLNPRQLRK